MSDNRRSIGVTVFGALLIISGLTGAVKLAIPFFVSREGSWSESIFYIAEFAVLPAVLGMGILKLKNWARIVSLWLFCLAGLSSIFLMLTFGAVLSDRSDPAMGVKIIISILAICGPIVFFLTRPEVVQQFKREVSRE